MRRNSRSAIPAAMLALGLSLGLSRMRADERRFTYTYEPELMPRGGLEFESWPT